ncbi:GNAT family N-acetyltransferase [Rhodovulum euryhalinum]|uniref:RimJ/RimL family protein N-acetyltransferase n=1 Tax=Rhodovulum euryhalinum TaxID=35805 RepID=A0A4R2KUT2_9RHOB|nr:GNAT family protein [Rhodovulum euryhalinum]TCO73948.1 RimJ/RimL family protein N-acetyltransferase [Rhodovulum euryhalinum]
MTDDLPLGAALPDWTPPPRPPRAPMDGRYALLEPLDASRHAADLHAAFAPDPAIWTYLPYGPFPSEAAYRGWIEDKAPGADPLFFAVRSTATGRVAGVLSYLRIAPEAGSIEIGHVCLAPALQRTAAATEAVTLMIGRAFDAGYRRVEWKCNALNLASRRAAERLGFSYEGLFRQAGVVKGRNRDTAWFAAIDSDWPTLRAAYARWLDPANFSADGRQLAALSDLTRPLLAARDPVLAPGACAAPRQGG